MQDVRSPRNIPNPVIVLGSVNTVAKTLLLPFGIFDGPNLHKIVAAGRDKSTLK